MHRLLPRLASAACLTVAILLTNTALAADVAQDTPKNSALPASPTVEEATPTAADPFKLPDVVVTSQKTEQRLIEVPVSIEYYSGADLQDSQIRGTMDLATHTPNVFARVPEGHEAYANINIRGIVSGNADFFSPTVGMFTDGMNINGGLEPLFYDVESVEILRGPQGTLYGGNTLGGAIVVNSNKPKLNKWGGNASYALESYNTHITNGMLNIPLFEKAALRLAGVYRHSDGAFYNEVKEKPGIKGDQLALRGQLLLEPSDRFKINLNLNGYTKNSDFSMYETLAKFDSDPWKTNQGELGSLEVNSFGQILNMEYLGDYLGFTSITGHRTFSSKEKNDVDFSADYLLTDHFRLNNEQWTQELRLHSLDKSSRFQWLAGIYGAYEKQETKDNMVAHEDYITMLAGFPGLGEIDQLNKTTVDAYNAAAFAQGTYAITDKLFATAGLRYDHVTKYLDAVGDNTGENAAMLGFQGREKLTGKEEYSALLPKFALEYRFTPNFNVYGSVTAGYKPGGFQTTNAYLANKSYGSEYTWNYELGTKGSFLDNKLDIDASVFYIQMRDQQLYTLTSSHGAIISNAGQSHSTGFEVSMRARPLHGLELFGSYGLLKTTVDDAGGSPATYNGADAPYAPAYQAVVGGQYTLDCGLFARLENSFIGPYYLDSQNTTKQDPFSLMDAKIGYETDNYSVYIYGKNLLNTEYYTLAFDNSSAIPWQKMVGTMGNPRTFGVMLKAEF